MSDPEATKLAHCLLKRVLSKEEREQATLPNPETLHLERFI